MPNSPPRSHSAKPSILLVGSGTRFLSGISVYTARLAEALSGRGETSVILMRRLLPRRLYPGRSRVGSDLSRLHYGAADVFDGVDWFWLPSMVLAVRFLMRRRPRVVIFQWWTGSVLHSYIVLALVAKLFHAKIVVEFHEVQDTAELRLPWARLYARALAPRLLSLSSAFAVHSEHDFAELSARYRLADRPVLRLPPHGPYDHYQQEERRDTSYSHEETVNLLFFGVIRPYKGLESLVRAFSAIPPEHATGYRLTIVGETWEGWHLPARLISESPYRRRIDFVNRYVRDEEVDGFFSAADVVVLPYTRSAMSGPVHIAMAYGLPVIVTDVGGLTELVERYDGAVVIPPGDLNRLTAALLEAGVMKGLRFANPHSWEETAACYERFLTSLTDEAPARAAAGP